MNAKNRWTLRFMAVTIIGIGSAVAMEIFAAGDHNPDTTTWTDLIGDHVPAALTFAVLALATTWVWPHFIHRYWPRLAHPGRTGHREADQPMSDFWRSVVRAAIQAGWTSAASWLLAHHVPIPTHLTSGQADLLVGVVFLGVIALVRFLETRTGNSPAAQFCRALGRLLMLGAAWKPVYGPARINEPAPPVAADPAHQVVLPRAAVTDGAPLSDYADDRYPPTEVTP